MTLAIAPVIAREVRNEPRKAEYRPSRPARPYDGSPGEVDRTVIENLLYAVGGCRPTATNFGQKSASTRFFLVECCSQVSSVEPCVKNFCFAKIFSKILHQSHIFFVCRLLRHGTLKSFDRHRSTEFSSYSDYTDFI